MAAHPFIRLTALGAVLTALVTSCIYPIEVELPEATNYPLVVEGNLRIGEVSTMSITRVAPFEDDVDPLSETPQFLLRECYIEGEDGTRIPALDAMTYFYDNRVSFDTADLRTDQRYRVHLSSQRSTFETDWLEVCSAPVIDDLSYNKNDAFSELRIGLSMHCNGSKFFRWSFDETWEYHSYLNTDLEFDPESWEVGNYQGPNLYYCWKHVPSPRINLFSTEGQTEDRFEDLDFHHFPLNDQRLQVMYRMELILEAISQGSYAYWNNIRQNSDEQGSIFAPMPAQMAGNIHCVSGKEELVFGYIDATQPVKAVLYYDNSVENYFDVRNYPKPEMNEHYVETWDKYNCSVLYKRGFLPYLKLTIEDEETSVATDYFLWVLASCLDCRMDGGTKEKPADWPTNHR